MRQLQLILIPKTVCTASHAFHIKYYLSLSPPYYILLLYINFILESIVGKKWVNLELNEITINSGMDVPDN